MERFLYAVGKRIHLEVMHNYYFYYSYNLKTTIKSKYNIINKNEPFALNELIQAFALDF